MRASWSSWRVVLLPAMLLVPTGCDDPQSPRPLTEYPFAVATRTCGPADGPALAIFLSAGEVTDVPAAPPYFQFYLTRSPAELEGRTWSWPSTDESINAWECTVAGAACAHSPAGVIALGRFGPDSALTLTADLRLKSGERVRVRTTARWVSGSPLCG